MIDIEKVRAETPSCRNLIHFNNAGSSLMPNRVYEALIGHLALERDIGGYEAADAAETQLQAFYGEFAGLLGVDPAEIAYVENATRAWDMAFYSLPLREGDRIITHASEYVSNYLAFLQLAKRRGVVIDVAPSDSTGQVDVKALEALVGPRSRVIALTHIPTQGGLVNPAEEVGAIARRHGLIYLLDACQSVGQMVVDVRAIGCHLLSGTGRKFLRGPRGTGFLYVSNSIVDELDPPFIDLQSARWTGAESYELEAGARRFENWESFMAGRVALAEAVRYARSLGLANIEARVMDLAARLRKELAKIPGVTVRDLGARKSGIVTFTREAEEPQAIATRLRKQRINVSVSRITSARLDFSARGLTAVTRASIHYYNTEDEIERFCKALREG